MQINEQLALVIPIDRADGAIIYVHASPISRAVFEANFLILSKTFTALFTEGLSEISGPNVAALLLKKIGGDDAGPLLAEFRRLTNVILPGASGYETMPFDDAANAKLIDEEDVAEVLNRIVFFMLGWHGYPRKMRVKHLEGAASAWGAELTSRNSTDLAASLRISTETENTGETNSPSVPTIQVPGQAARPFSPPS